MKQAKRLMWAGAFALVAMLTAFGAHALDILVGTPTDFDTDPLIGRTDLPLTWVHASSIGEAIGLVVGPTTIWLLPGPNADAFPRTWLWPTTPVDGLVFSIVGYPKTNILPPFEQPQDVIIKAPAQGNVNLGSNSKITFEALTFTGGVTVGVGCEATLNRCYIHGNIAGPGVLCDDGATRLTLVNCSISQNMGHGVYVKSGAAIINFCSIIKNAGCGVITESDARASVRNSILYYNNYDSVSTSYGYQLFGAGSMVIEGGFNDIYTKPQTAINNNYFNNGGDTDVYPGLDPAGLDPTGSSWAGKLLLGSPVTDMADPLESEVWIDFEGNPRPMGPVLPPLLTPRRDIGADELFPLGNITEPTWISCSVYPNPAGTSSFTLAGKSRLTVSLVFYDPNGTTIQEAFIVPQGGRLKDIDNNDNRLDWIVLTLDPTRSGGILYTYTYTGPDFVTCEKLLSNGLLVDGHAAVYIRVGGDILSPIENTAFPPYVLHDAAMGGHFLIDTIPPVPLDAYFEPAGPNSVFSANNIVSLHNDGPFAALGVPSQPFRTAWGTYPSYPYPAPDGYPQYDLELNSPTLRPSHAPYAPNPPMQVPFLDVFFNVGSFANGYNNGPNLNIGLTAQFRDRDARTIAGITNNMNDTDEWDSSRTTRTVSGFRSVTQNAGEAADVLNSRLPVYCELSNLSTVLTIQADAFASDPGGMGFWYGLPPSLPEVSGNWSFPPSGLPVVSGQTLAMKVNFDGRDRAGNESSRVNMPDLRIWWLRGSTNGAFPPNQMNVPINLRSMPGAFPTLEWALVRPGLSPQFERGPNPIYTYRIFGQVPQFDPNYPYYLPLTDWEPWGKEERNMSLTSIQFESLQALLTPPDSLYGRWLLVVVAACDEAGNVSPWPYEPVTGVGLRQIAPNLVSVTPPDPESGWNWRRFYIPPASEVVDTRLTADFVRGVSDLGPVSVMSSSDYGLPKDLQAVFTVSLVGKDQSDFPNSFVEVELLEDGKSVFLADLWGRLESGSTQMMGDPVRTITIPRDLYPALYGQSPRGEIKTPTGDPQAGFPPDETISLYKSRLGHPDNPDMSLPDWKGKTVDYVFRATTVYRNVSTGEVTRDSSPATFAFKVVRQPVEQYLETPSGKQPTKVFERE